jgi:hypothetical protein
LCISLAIIIKKTNDKDEFAQKKQSIASGQGCMATMQVDGDNIEKLK